MKIILLQDVKGLGKKNDIKDVSDGYARNFLLPKKLVRLATAEAIKEIEKHAAEKEKMEDEIETQLKELSAKIKNAVFDFYPAIGKNQEVFESVTKNDIKEAIVEKFLKNPSEAMLKKIRVVLDKPLKTIGEHKITVLIDGEKSEIKAIINQKRIE